MTQKPTFSSKLLAYVLATTLFYGASGCTRKAEREPPNTVHMSHPEKVKGLDPAFADDLYSSEEVGKTYEGLLQYHYLKRPFTLIPNLAEAMPEVSPDGKTYTIRIKKGVLFQDDPCFKQTGGKGRELTADDFVYSFKRIADPKIASTGWWIFDEKVEGLNAWRDEASKSGAADYSKEVVGLKAVDRYTLQIKLIRRSSQFMYALAMPFSFVVAREAVEHYGKEFLNHPVGTGPFRLEEFNGSSKIIWARNPTYRKEVYPSEGEAGDRELGLLTDAGQTLPRADRIVTHIFVETQPLWLSFLSERIDFSPIPKDNYSSAITPSRELAPELHSKGIRLIKRYRMDITHVSFNMEDPLLGKNRFLRQALSMAVDPDAVVELFYNGRALPAQSPIPPDMNGYDANFKNPYRRFNLAKAKELLAKAGYPEGRGLPPLVYLTIADSTHRQISEFYEKSFAQIGVRLKVNSFSWPEFQQAYRNRRGQLWGRAWNADYPDAENFLQLFYSKNIQIGGSNDSGYSNPEFDRLYEKALTLKDSPERSVLYQKMARIVVDDAPWIFGVHRIGYSLVHPWIKNYKPHEYDVGSSKYFRIDPAVKSSTTAR